MSGYAQLMGERFLNKPVAMLCACEDYVILFHHFFLLSNSASLSKAKTPIIEHRKSSQPSTHLCVS
jgi:hypothetical protein